jgi:hypothetical protein
MEKILPDSDKCLELASVLKEISMNVGFLERPFIRHPMDKELRLRMMFFSVAICHQTHKLVSEKRNLRGWEYMEEVFLEMAIRNPEFLDPLNISGQTKKSIGTYLLKSFSDEKKQASSSLDRVEERAELYLDSAKRLQQGFDGNLSSLVKKSANKLIHAGEGIYELLGDFQAYSDPLRKKAGFFLKLCLDAGLIHIMDPENLIPIMDYHMQRVLLRTGCIVIKDSRLAEDLRRRRPLQSDQEIRKACTDALKIISDASGHSVLGMNDIFWPLGRSCCHEKCLCETGSCEREPCTLLKTMDIISHEQCIFDPCCRGKQDLSFRSLWQPEVYTHFY